MLNKRSYGPEEREMLPLMAVFTREVTCKSCNYATKVRSNMMRHLEQHALGCEPSPVPVVNPVPYLERNEKMFDTMTNHAISSTIPVRRDSNAFKVLILSVFLCTVHLFLFYPHLHSAVLGHR